MIGHLYKYPHPVDTTRFIYVGQGSQRDTRHRHGHTSFGRRFLLRFPNHELPQPIRWTVEVSNQTELNEEETIAMFRYHTWRGYENGMNLLLPSSEDYKVAGLMQPHEAKIRGGQTQGRKNVESGFVSKIGIVGGRIMGLKHKASKTGIFAPENLRTGGLARAKQQQQNKTGFFGPDHKIWAAKGGLLGGKKGALKLMKLKLGIHGRTPEQMLKDRRKGSCQRWNINRNKHCVCHQH